MRRITGAILRVTVPAIIMRSDCRGEARKTPAPKRSKSYRDEEVAIISMAQQARPNVIGHKADFRDQFTTASRLVVRIFASNCLSRKLICSTPSWQKEIVGIPFLACVERGSSEAARSASTKAVLTVPAQSHSNAPFFQAYQSPASRMPMNKS